MRTILYAWRNLWRNGRRTAITLAAVALNTAILITTGALMDGMLLQTVLNATDLVVGEVQVHAPGYLEDHSIYKSLLRPGKMLQKLGARGIGAAPRIYGYGLLSRGTKSAGAFFWGIDPSLEQKTFVLPNHLQSGQFLSIEPNHEIILGKKLAHALHAKIGAEIVIVVQAADGSMGNDLFTVRGVLKSAGDAMDRSAALLHEHDFRELFVLPVGAHEIALNTNGRKQPEKLAVLARRLFPDAEVRTWKELIPTLADMVNVSRSVIWIFGAIFFLAAGMGVMNTMLMATYERFHEFGVQKALGATPWRIMREVLAEVAVLWAIASLAGALLGLLISFYLETHGIDTRSIAGDITIVGVAFNPIWKAAISADGVVWSVVIMGGVCLVAALYPAAIAARIEPVKAIYHT